MSMQAHYILSYCQGDSVWEEYPIDETDLLIGRTSDCDLQLDNPEVSRYHASLKVASDGLWLMDMGSTNGTLVDGQPLPANRRVALQPGQNIVIGPFTLTVRDVPEERFTQLTIVRPAFAKPDMYDLDSLRQNEFPLMAERVYLNNANAAPLPLRTRNKMHWSVDRLSEQPSLHLSHEGLQMYGGFVTALAQFINAETPYEIAVTTSCAAAINLIAQSLVLEPGDSIAFCDLEYPANAYPWMSLERDGIVIKQVPSTNGGLTLDALEAAVDERTRVVAASTVQFFSGHRTDLAAIGRFCRERGVIFVVDAIQSIGHIPIDVQQMQIDVLVTGGQKSLLAAPGVGFMYVRDAVCDALRPRLISAISVHNWSFYLDYDLTPEKGAMRFVMGTPPLSGMFGLLESVGLINELTREAINWHTTRLISYALDRAETLGYELVTPRGRHGPIATFKSGLDDARTDALLAALEEQKITIGKHLDKQGVPHLRLSVHCFNDQDDIDCLFDALQKETR